MLKKYINFPAEFWFRVDIKSINECWNWKSSSSKIFSYYRTAYELTCGKIPDNKIILHLCNNPKCCNPMHLKLGTQKENMQQMLKEGRGKKFSKISKEQVIEIRNIWKNGNISQKQIAEKFNISQSQISSIVNNKYWRYLCET